MTINVKILTMLLENIFITIFDEKERIEIRSAKKFEPLITRRKAFILWAYMNGYSEYEIARCINRNARQTRYLLEKAEDLYFIGDRELTRIMKSYEEKLGKPCERYTKID